MRVLRLASVFRPPAACLTRGVRLDPVGGMQNHTGALTDALDRLGVEQDVVTAHRSGAGLRSSEGDHATVWRVGLPVAAARQLWAAPAAALAATLGRRADLVHAHLGEDVAVLPIAAATARLHGLPLVVTVHTSVAHTLVTADARSRRVKALGGPAERWACARADAVITLTHRLRRAVLDGGVDPGRVHVIPSGVREETFGLASGARDPLAALPRPRVAFVGRLHHQKDVLTLVEAAARMRSGAHVALVGDGPDRGAVEAAIARLGLADRVHLLGFVAHEQVPEVLAAADVFCLPSRYEELGSALLEAMRAGLPIVASRTGGIPEVVHDGVNGVLVDPGDPAALAAALDAVVEDPERRARLGAAGARAAQAFRWDRLAPRVLAAYEQALGLPGAVAVALPVAGAEEAEALTA